MAAAGGGVYGPDGKRIDYIAPWFHGYIAWGFIIAWVCFMSYFGWVKYGGTGDGQKKKKKKKK